MSVDFTDLGFGLCAVGFAALAVALRPDAVASAVPRIPLPRNLYPDRLNSLGVDLARRDVLDYFEEKIRSDRGRENLGTVESTTAQELDFSVARAVAAFDSWNRVPASERAAALERTADAMDRRMQELASLIVREGGRTYADAVSEVREAADFCRYYALQARKHFANRALAGPAGEKNELSLHGRGVFACIAPWNFPLAIFTGQIAAALAAGNTVIAKPAEQTPRIGFRAVELREPASRPTCCRARWATAGPSVRRSSPTRGSRVSPSPDRTKPRVASTPRSPLAPDRLRR
jgi:RHH-type proline utilization regulon transcriptional repressor/proline dehydrogenase/delta 1-pyrroline-5-carboxylate dehydrogenase